MVLRESILGTCWNYFWRTYRWYINWWIGNNFHFGLQQLAQVQVGFWMLRKQIETGALSPTFVRPKMEVLRLYKVALPVRITYDMTSPTLGTGTGLFFLSSAWFLISQIGLWLQLLSTYKVTWNSKFIRCILCKNFKFWCSYASSIVEKHPNIFPADDKLSP